jgi:hypothetical protein
MAAFSEDDTVDRRHDLADHFLDCCKLGRYLTVVNDSRFIITDDFRGNPVLPAAAAVAAIYSRDALVAQAALLPLGHSVRGMSSQERDRYEHLFALIEAETLSDDVRGAAGAIISSRFLDAEVRSVEADLDDRLSPARTRYRTFLAVVRQLMDGQITASAFLDEFRDFTKVVAGKLDFGIYSFCLDRIFASPLIPVQIKKLLVIEVFAYPPMIRRELLTNILSSPGLSPDLSQFIERRVVADLGDEMAIELELLRAVKSHRLSVEDIEKGVAEFAH